MTGRETFDWAGARERLHQAMRTVEEGPSLSPEAARRILDARARALAAVPAPLDATGELLEVLTFVLSGEHYAIEARYCRRVQRLVDYTTVPGAPAYVVGVTNVGGEVVMVVDLRHLLGQEVRGITDLSRVIVLGADDTTLGILADETRDIRRVSTADLHPPPGTGSGGGDDLHHLRGVTGDALAIVNAEILLGDPRLFLGEETSR